LPEVAIATDSQPKGPSKGLHLCNIRTAQSKSVKQCMSMLYVARHRIYIYAVFITQAWPAFLIISVFAWLCCRLEGTAFIPRICRTRWDACSG